MSDPDPIRAIADAVLYEGYVLWPYRRSALKNTQRWTFGGVYPHAHAQGRAPGDDPWYMQAQGLIEAGGESRVNVGLRFLQIVWRQVLDGDGQPRDELVVDDELHLSWEEAVEREVGLGALTLAELARDGCLAAISIPAGREREPLGSSGAIVRSWQALQGSLWLGAEELAPGLFRLTVRVENRTPFNEDSPRAAALRSTFCSAHAILHALDGGAFVSQTDPPASLREHTNACESSGWWPVLVGAPGERHTLLATPIILEDHPRIAPESPGDLFDGGEIDQLLILNILQLTEREKREARASDPRVREILDRSEGLSPEQLMRLHGRTVRELQVRR